MKTPIVLLTVLLATVGTGFAQDDPATIEDPRWGLRFTPPAGWTQQPAPEGYLFASPSRQGFILLIPHEARTLDALRDEARQGIADGAGTQLRLRGAIERFGDDGLAADFDGRVEGHPAKARAVSLIAPHGPGVTLVAAAAPDAYTHALTAQVEAVARSVVFTTPPDRAEDASPAGPEEREWHAYLSGCRLYVNNAYNSGDGSGIIAETTIDLCPAYFSFSDHDLAVFNETDPVSGDAPYLHDDRDGAGRWRIVRQGDASVLQLRFHHGAVKTFTLGWEDGKTFLDGRRWLRSCNVDTSVGPRCR